MNKKEITSRYYKNQIMYKNLLCIKKKINKKKNCHKM